MLRKQNASQKTVWLHGVSEDTVSRDRERLTIQSPGSESLAMRTTPALTMGGRGPRRGHEKTWALDRQGQADEETRASIESCPSCCVREAITSFIDSARYRIFLASISGKRFSLLAYDQNCPTTTFRLEERLQGRFAGLRIETWQRLRHVANRSFAQCFFHAVRSFCECVTELAKAGYERGGSGRGPARAEGQASTSTAR